MPYHITSVKWRAYKKAVIKNPSKSGYRRDKTTAVETDVKPEHKQTKEDYMIKSVVCHGIINHLKKYVL